MSILSDNYILLVANFFKIHEKIENTNQMIKFYSGENIPLETT
jgi:hypothetical protein